jgi:protein disulfide-isomerase A1
MFVILFLSGHPANTLPFSAKMEATENDLPASLSFQVSGFPTIKFKPAGSRDFIDYDGDRTLESLVEFVEKTAKNSLEPPAPAQDDAQEPLTQSTPVVEESPAVKESVAATEEGTHDEL